MKKIKTFEDYALAMDRVVKLMASVKHEALKQDGEFLKLSKRIHEYEYGVTKGEDR